MLVVEDGPTLTHGEMAYGAGVVAARRFGAAEIVDPRPYAVGSIAETYEKYPTTGSVLPAMGYGEEQMADLEETINDTPCDLVIIATPIDLRRVVKIRQAQPAGALRAAGDRPAQPGGRVGGKVFVAKVHNLETRPNTGEKSQRAACVWPRPFIWVRFPLIVEISLHRLSRFPYRHIALFLVEWYTCCTVARRQITEVGGTHARQDSGGRVLVSFGVRRDNQWGRYGDVYFSL